MERTKIPQRLPHLSFSKPLVDLLLKEKASPDLLALYTFCCYSIYFEDKSSVPVDRICVKFGWSLPRVKRLLQRLNELNLLEFHTGAIYLMKSAHRITPHDFICNISIKDRVLHQNIIEDQVGTRNRTILDPSPNNPITLSMFEAFWNLYPKHPDKSKARIAWSKLCDKDPKERPTWRKVKSAILKQRKTVRWQTRAYIPHPTTWLNQGKWEDDPNEMNEVWGTAQTQPTCPFNFVFGKTFGLKGGCDTCEEIHRKTWLQCQIANQTKSWK